jgi:hypothetical protein
MCLFTRGPQHPSFFFKGAHEMGCRSRGGATGACQSGLNCANRVSTPRAVAKEPLPTTLRFPSPHPQTQSTSFLPEAEATRAWPPPHSQRMSTSRGRGAEPAANGVAAAQYRGAAHTITAPPDRRRARPGVGCARQPRALEARRTSRAPRKPRSAASAPPRSRAHSSAPSPSPLHPGPAARPALEAPRESSSSEPPSSPNRSSTARGRAGGEGSGRGPGTSRVVGSPRTPYLGGRRGADRRSSSGSEPGGRR